MEIKLSNEEKRAIDLLSKKYQVVSKNNIQEKIKDEIKNWKQEVSKKLNIENPFYYNKLALQNSKNQFNRSNNYSIASFEKDFKNFNHLSTIVPFNIDIDFWNNEIQKFKKYNHKVKYKDIKITSKNKKEELPESKIQKDDIKISHKLLLSQWEKELDIQYLKWELETIENYRKELFKKLEKWLNLVQKIDDLLCDLSIDTGLLFDLSEGNISLNDIEQLKKWVEYISKDKGVKELCDMLGRVRRAEKSLRKEMIKTSSQVTEYIPDTNSNEEIVGIKLGRDIEHTLAQELALLGDDETSILFDMKYIEGKLMCFDMEGLQEKTFEIEKEEIVEVSYEEKLGPIIICVDTSGSMSGSPETIAKAVTLYMATRAIQQKRDCFLINFSTNIETLDISDGMGIATVIKFLKKSFNGGTDVAPALNHALSLMSEEKYKKSDLLIISDFVMSSLSDTMRINIENAKLEKNKFYSLSIGNLFLESKLKNIFDDEWVYNPQNSSIHSIVEIIKKI